MVLTSAVHCCFIILPLDITFVAQYVGQVVDLIDPPVEFVEKCKIPLLSTARSHLCSRIR